MREVLSLGNDELSLTVLDPVEDEERLGTRYVSGCYVYQVEDARLGPLLSGPVYPRDPPPVFDGQGVPEAFRHTLGPVEGKRLVLGSALIADDGRGGARQVAERCHWRVEPDGSRLRMSTAQRFADWALDLQREIALDGRQITSSTRVANTGTAPLPLTWYAHPFFPWPADGVCCRFSGAASLPDNPGFRIGADGFVERIAGHDWQKGQFVQFAGVAGHRLEAVQRHPKVGEVRVRGDFEMWEMPIWGNACTVSFEPYLQRELAPGAHLAWSLVYCV